MDVGIIAVATAESALVAMYGHVTDVPQQYGLAIVGIAGLERILPSGLVGQRVGKQKSGELLRRRLISQA